MFLTLVGEEDLFDMWAMYHWTFATAFVDAAIKPRHSPITPSIRTGKRGTDWPATEPDSRL